MEDYLIIGLTIVIGVFALMGMKMFKPNTKVKSSTNKAKDTLSKVHEETIDRLSVELRKVNGRANRLQALRNNELEELEEESPENGSKEVTWDQIQQLVKVSYPKYSPMLPLLKNQIMDAVKGMSMEEIIAYVKQINPNQQSQGSPSPQSAQYNPDWA